MLGVAVLAEIGLGVACCQAEFAIRDGDRVVIYGDSITAGAEYPGYPRYLEAYVRTRFPAWTTRFWNRGWGGDTAANLDRFKRDCLSLKPDVITFNMGMNDGGYRPAVAEGLRAFVESIEEMVRLAREGNPEVRIFLVSPILFETKVAEERSFYPYVLWSYAREERELARRLNVGFIDVNRSYGESIGLADAMFPDSLVFSGDGIHPMTAGGHLLIAAHILDGLDAPGELASLVVDAGDGRVLSATGQAAAVVAVDDSQLVIERTLDALPFPVIPSANGVTYMDRSIAFLACVAEDLNRDTLRIAGLQGEAYRLAIDGKAIADLSAAELRDGVNLSRYFNTPDQEQAVRVCELVGEKQQLQWQTWHKHLAVAPGDPALGDEARQIGLSLDRVRDAAQPRKHRFTLSVLDRDVDRYQRYEQMLEMKARRSITFEDDDSPESEFSVMIRNLSLSERRLEISWSGGKTRPALSTLTLAPEESRDFVFEVDIGSGDRPPVLEVRHYPVDLSFPAVVQRLMPELVARLEVAPAEAPINVDGDLSDWSGPPTIDLDTRMTRATVRRRVGKGDFSATVRMLRDAKYLYAAVRVQDQDHVNHFTDDRISWDDAVILKLGARRFVLALTANGPAILPREATEQGVQYGITRDAQETRYEAAIPWAETGAGTGEPEAVRGFDVMVADRDANESHKTVKWRGSLLVR